MNKLKCPICGSDIRVVAKVKNPNNQMNMKIINVCSINKGYCTLTSEMDKYLNDKLSIYNTYVYDYGDRKYFDGVEGHTYSLRVAGVSVGDIITNANNIIEFIHFYKDTCYKDFKRYDKAMDSIKIKYIGKQIVEHNIEYI